MLRVSLLRTDRANLKEDAANYLRELILTGELRPNSKIDQEEIAQRLGISRLPVREALIGLSQEGLVVTPPRRGAFVAELQRADVLDHYLIYGLVSGIAAERAAKSLGDEELAELRRVHEELLSASDPELAEELNFQFHRIINTAASSRLRAVLRLLRRSLPSHFYTFVPDWREHAIAQHARVLAAIEVHDGTAARSAMETHLTDAGVDAVTILEAAGFWFDKSSGA
jgi:DNA-binding GntR family transcriptional regulator